MIDIKFRSWSVEEKIMHDIALPSWNGTHEVWENNIPQSKVAWLTDGPEMEGILMQYTGLKDSKGVEIYEGDIIAIDGKNAVVRYEEDYGAYILEWEWLKNQHYRNLNCDSISHSVIIGNKYQNPELLIP